jgi:hypothetical protein
MAGQEIEGDLWDQSLGLDLLPTIVCSSFRTLSSPLCKTWGMAGQEIEGDLWDQSLGLDLLPTIVCSSFRTLSSPLCKTWGAETHV